MTAKIRTALTAATIALAFGAAPPPTPAPARRRGHRLQRLDGHHRQGSSAVVSLGKLGRVE